uniref:Transposase (putative) gypsy type domain-containing protein n=1 Tax=Fagus sylvatica TaxID=28930 RepID=A0A2N9FHG6_FAGSY
MAVFRHLYEIPTDVGLRYVHWSDALPPSSGELLIPMVAVVEGGVRFPMDPFLADFLSYFSLSPTQVNPNIFRIVMGTVELNKMLGLELSTYDIVWTYILHHNSKTESYSLRPRDINFTLVNGLPDTNRGFDDDYLVVSGEWFLPGRKCPTRDGVPDPRRRTPRKNLIKINSLRRAWESELCTDDYAQPRSAPLLLRYTARTHSYLACSWMPFTCGPNEAPGRITTTCGPNEAPVCLGRDIPAIDIRDVLDTEAPDMSGINLRNLLPTRRAEGTSESVPASSQPARKKKARVESPGGPSRPSTFAQPGLPASEAQETVHVTQLGNVVRSVMEMDCILPVSNARSASVTSALSQVVRLPLDMEEWKKAADEELINNLRRGLLMGVQASLELEDRFRANKDHLAHANVLAAKYQDAKKMAAEAKRLANSADAKRVEAEESFNAALDSLTKAKDKVRALELELERAKKEAYESGSKEAQDEMGRQLPRVCNEYYTDAWNDAIAVLNSGQTMLPPDLIKLPFPGATPPSHPEAVLNSLSPPLGAVMVDLEVESAEAAGPVDAGLHDAPDGGSAAPGEAGLNNS